MIESNFLTTFKKKIDRLDADTIKNILIEVIEENENLKTLFNSMKEAVIVLNDKGEINFYNKMTLKVLNCFGKNLTGTYYKDLIDNFVFNETIDNALQKEEKIEDFFFRLDAEPVKYLSLSLDPLVSNSKIIGSIIVLDDITNDIINKNKLRQAESLAALTTISAGIAHEIKNPLAAISIHMQLIEEELAKEKYDLSEEFRSSLSVIRDEMERLNDIVVDYLSAVRPMKAELALSNLNHFLDNFIDFIMPELIVNKIKLIKNYSELPNVWLDEKYFRQALLNLIKNSISSIKENGEIRIEAYKKNNYVYINITDNGSGVSKEIETKIFDPYFTTKKFGTGLGLTIVYKIIKEHRGEITFKSNPKETIFSIKLPLTEIKEGLIEYRGE